MNQYLAKTIIDLINAGCFDGIASDEAYEVAVVIAEDIDSIDKETIEALAATVESIACNGKEETIRGLKAII